MDEYYTWYVGSVRHKDWPEFMYMYVDHWPIFYGPVILPYILKTIWWTNVIIRTLVPCDAKIYLIKCMCFSDLHFMLQWFCLILKTIWWLNVVLEILIQCDTNIDFRLYMEVSDLYFMVHWFCLIHLSWRLFDGQIIIGILDLFHAKIYHIKCMWVNDLHFMVQWFCLI